MDAQEFAETLEDLVRYDIPEEAALHGLSKRTSSDEEKGVLTTNEGFIVRMMDGAEFQITVVRSRREQE